MRWDQPKEDATNTKDKREGAFITTVHACNRNAGTTKILIKTANKLDDQRFATLVEAVVIAADIPDPLDSPFQHVTTRPKRAAPR
jgi:hypothetical protein